MCVCVCVLNVIEALMSRSGGTEMRKLHEWPQHLNIIGPLAVMTFFELGRGEEEEEEGFTLYFMLSNHHFTLFQPTEALMNLKF